MNLLQRWRQTSIANKLSVSTGAIVAFGTVAQFCVLKESSRQADQQSTKLAEVAGRIASSFEQNNAQNVHTVERTLGQSKAALEAQIQLFRLDQRAWLAPSIFTLDKELAPGQTVFVAPSFINTGKTPATRVREQTLVKFSGTIPGLPRPTSPPKETAIVFPNATLSFPPESYVLPRGPVGDENGGLFVMVVVSYDDVFGCHHSTHTYRVHVAGHKLDDFGYCQTGDDVDTIQNCGQPKQPRGLMEHHLGDAARLDASTAPPAPLGALLRALVSSSKAAVTL